MPAMQQKPTDAQQRASYRQQTSYSYSGQQQQLTQQTSYAPTQQQQQAQQGQQQQRGGASYQSQAMIEEAKPHGVPLLGAAAVAGGAALLGVALEVIRVVAQRRSKRRS